MSSASNAAKAPFKKPWSSGVPIKDADLERLLEKLDLIIKDVEQVADHIANRLGVELSEDGGDTEELEDSSSESEVL